MNSPLRFQNLSGSFLNLLLLLLCTAVIEVLTSSTNGHRERRVFLTGATAGPMCFPGRLVPVHLTLRGELFWEKERITLEELTYHAIALHQNDEDGRVVISASAGTSLKRVVEVFSVLQRQHVRYVVETAFVEQS